MDEREKLIELLSNIERDTDLFLYSDQYLNNEDIEIIADYLLNAGYHKQNEGKWELCDDDFSNDMEFHRCSVCKAEAIFECIYQPMYDENYDGEMEYIAEEFAGIREYLTEYCPSCGAKLKGGDSDA